jgi:hypothetical protein
MTTQVSFTKFKNNQGLLTKTATIKDDNLIRGTQPALYDGTFEVLSIDWADYGSVLSSLDYSEALCPGINIKGKTKGKIVKGTRTLKNFGWNPEDAPGHNLILFDLDQKSKTSKLDLLSQLLTICPELNNLSNGFWLYPSSSAHITDKKGKDLTGLKGLHIYMLCPAYIPPSEIKDYMKACSWIAGTTEVRIMGGAQAVFRKDYSFADDAVFSPERLMFSAGCSCDDTCSQRRGEPLFVEATGREQDIDFLNVDFEEATRIRFSERRKLNDKVKELKKEKANAMASLEKIPNYKAEDLVYTDSADSDGSMITMSASTTVDTTEGKISVIEMMMKPSQYHMRGCQDVLDPEAYNGASGKAIIYTDGDDGTVRIHSFVHGKRIYLFEVDQASVELLLRRYNHRHEDLMEDNKEWLGLLASEKISEEDRSELAEVIYDENSKDFKNLTSVHTLITGKSKSKVKSLLGKKLEEMNEKWALVSLDSTNCVCYESLDSTNNTYYKKKQVNAFHELESKNTVFTVGAQGKSKPVSVSKTWMTWPDRREYDGFAFRPAIDERRVDGNKFNLFQGFGVKRSRAREGCDKTACKGLGCLMWSRNNKFKICKAKECNWTYWANHVYENICSKDEQAALWVISWFCDIVQNPENKPGTSLCIWGGAGSGKSGLVAPFQEILGSTYQTVNGTQDVTGDFNGHFAGKLLMECDEATFKGDLRSVNRLKSVTTSRYLTINEKNIPKYSIPNYVRQFLTANDSDFVKSEFDERRQMLLKAGNARQNDYDYFARFHPDGDFRKSKDRITCKPSIEEFLDEVLSWEMTDIHKIIETDALKASKTLSYSVEKRVFVELVNQGYGREHDRVFNNAVKELYVLDFRDQHITPNQFMGKFKKLMNELGFVEKRLKLDTGEGGYVRYFDLSQDFRKKLDASGIIID